MHICIHTMLRAPLLYMYEKCATDANMHLHDGHVKSHLKDTTIAWSLGDQPA